MVVQVLIHPLTLKVLDQVVVQQLLVVHPLILAVHLIKPLQEQEELALQIQFQVQM